MSFQDDSVKFPENEREKMAICYEFLVQEWKEMFGVTIGQKMEELTETQLCEFRPYLDGIVAIYNREALASAGVKLPAADGEDDDYLVVFPAMVLLGLVVTTSSIICATFLASLPAYWIAAFGTPMGIQISLDVAAVGLAITTGAALAWATVTFFGGGGGEGGGGEGGGSEGEGGSGECSPLTISFTKLCFIVDAKKPEKSGVYIRRNDTEKAKDELAVEECTSKTPGSACFIREILKSPVSVKAFFKNSSGKGTFHLYPTVTIGGQRISVGDVEGEFSETENYVVLNLSAADLVREDQARIAISFRGIDKSGIVKAVEQSADVLSCVFDKLPALPFNVTDAEKAPALSDFERYKELKGAVKGGLTAMAIARDLRARYEIERRAASACVAEGAGGTLDVVYSEMKKIFAVGETTGKVKCACNSLEFGVMYWMTCALCGIQVNILKVVSPLAPVCMDGTRVAPAFPLEFPSGFLGNGNNLSLFEYYLPESWNEAKGCFVPYDVFSEVPNTQEYSFAGRTKSFYYPVKDSYQSQMIACGTPARVAEYYSDCNLVECLPRIDVKDGAVGENGFAKEEALITYDGKEKQFVLQDGSLDLDPVFLNTMGEDEIQERIGLDVIGRLLVNFINQGFGSEQKSAAGKLTGLLQMIVSGGLPVAYTEIETVLNDRMEALETMLEGADTVQILNAANLILAGCRNLPANFVMSGNLWKRDAASYSPAEWFYYSDHRVWAYEGGIFEDGISYKNFKEENLGVGKVEKELEEGIYLTSVYDQIRLGYIIENLKDFKGVRLYYKLLRGKEGRKIIFVANAACNTFQYNPYDYQEYRLSAEMVRDPEMRWIHLKI